AAVGVEIMRSVADVRLAIALDQRLHALKLLADRIVVAGKRVDRQVLADVREAYRGSQARGRAKERRKGLWLEVFEGPRVAHDRIDDCVVAAEPIERRPRRLERVVEDVDLPG